MTSPPYWEIRGRTLSGVDWRTSTKTAAPPGWSFAPRSFMKLSSTPTSVAAPAAAPVAPPMAAPSSGMKKMRPMRPPHSAPPGRAAGHGLEGLAQLDLAVVLPDGDREVLELDRMLLLQLHEGLPDFASGCLVGVSDGYEIAHAVLHSSGSPPRGRPVAATIERRRVTCPHPTGVTPPHRDHPARVTNAHPASREACRGGRRCLIPATRSASAAG